MHKDLKYKIVQFTLIALAYIATAKLGLLVPYKESIATLIWLPTGIAVGAIMRWGNVSLPAIYLGAVVAELSVGVPFFASLAIAITNTIAPFFTAYLLNKSKFNHTLINQRDIALMISIALLGMLISASGGVLILYLFDLLTLAKLSKVWFIWWMGDTIGVLLALPLLLNLKISKITLHRHQYYQLFSWLLFYLVVEWLISGMMISVNKQFMWSLFMILPVLIWASMNFGIVGGSLVVISLSSIAVWSTSRGYGSFYSMNADEGIFSLWTFILTLVVMMLLISVLQAERNLAERALLSNARKLRSMVDGALDAILTINEKGQLVEFNPAAERIFGYKKSDVMGKTLAEVIIPPSLRAQHTTKHKQYVETGVKHIFDRRIEITGMRSDGSEFPIELTLTALKDNDLNLVTGFIRDISQQKKDQQEIENIAYYDVLTGLPNRRLLMDRFQRAALNAKRIKSYCSLIFVDLDHFKTINDTKGHDVGDQLLIEVAKRVKETIRAGDSVARLSGDEFILIIENLDNYQVTAYHQTAEILQKLLVELNKPYVMEMFEFNMTASMGVTLFNDDEVSFEDHLRHADTAMYQAKTAGRNTYRFYDQLTQQNLEKGLAIEAGLHTALKNKELFLNYQNIVDAEQNIIAAEVLLRWIHPQFGEISPVEFIPIAEKNNLIIKIGYWVLQQACAQIKTWEKDASLNKVRLSVNISAKQFLYVNFIQELRDLIKANEINPDYLKLELTETAVIDNIDDVIIKMNILREMGVRISLDDFGMGHSSLIYLKKLPFTQIKIDQSFVHDVLTDINDAAIIQMILAIGQTLQCSIVAEGVESLEQFEMLKKFGCDHFQGFYFSKPVAIDEFEKGVRFSVQ
ncbi:MAG TPA: EAL domain-containing protein [Methylotenera sp.]|nr:EAL domain-containing protein [Methylotenera sp.]